MYNLAFDTTGQSCSVILTKDGETLEKSVKKMDFGQAEVLLPTIQNILENHGITMKELDLITVCTGPGSFTGVRSSLSAARTFGLALPEIGLTGVSSFEAYVEDIEPDELAEINAIIIETKREDFYVQLFDVHKKPLIQPQALNYADIIDKLRNHKVTLVGDGVERFLSQPSGLSLHAIKMEEMLSISALARCGANRYIKKCLDYPKPLYLRAPDVCVKA